jgi:hypothetical protein
LFRTSVQRLDLSPSEIFQSIDSRCSSIGFEGSELKKNTAAINMQDAQSSTQKVIVTTTMYKYASDIFIIAFFYRNLKQQVFALLTHHATGIRLADCFAYHPEHRNADRQSNLNEQAVFNCLAHACTFFGL